MAKSTLQLLTPGAQSLDPLFFKAAGPRSDGREDLEQAILTNGCWLLIDPPEKLLADFQALALRRARVTFGTGASWRLKREWPDGDHRPDKVVLRYDSDCSIPVFSAVIPRGISVMRCEVGEETQVGAHMGRPLSPAGALRSFDGRTLLECEQHYLIFERLRESGWRNWLASDIVAAFLKLGLQFWTELPDLMCRDWSQARENNRVLGLDKNGTLKGLAMPLRT